MGDLATTELATLAPHLQRKLVKLESAKLRARHEDEVHKTLRGVSHALQNIGAVAIANPILAFLISWVSVDLLEKASYEDWRRRSEEEYNRTIRVVDHYEREWVSDVGPDGEERGYYVSRPVYRTETTRIQNFKFPFINEATGGELKLVVKTIALAYATSPIAAAALPGMLALVGRKVE